MGEITKKLPLYFAKASIGTHAVLAVGKLVLAIFSFSFFMCINAFYNVGMALAKYYFHLGYDEKKSLKEQQDYYRIIGIIVLISSLIFTIYSIRIFLGGKSSAYPEIIGITIATFTFTEITLDIKGLVSSWKTNNIMLKANRLTSFASSLICLVLTQTALMSFAHDGDPSVANGISGVFFGSGAALIGVYMIVHIYRVGNGNYEKSIKKRAYKIMKKNGVTALPLYYEENGENGRALHVRIDKEYSQDTYEFLSEILKKKMHLELVCRAES